MTHKDVYLVLKEIFFIFDKVAYLLFKLGSLTTTIGNIASGKVTQKLEFTQNKMVLVKNEEIIAETEIKIIQKRRGSIRRFAYRKKTISNASG